MLGYDGFEPYGRRRSITPGVVLVGAGVVCLFWVLLSPTGAVPLLILGGVLTGIALRNGTRGLLVPGSLMLGLAVGVIAAALLGHISGAYGAAATLGGLGAGFLALPMLDRIRQPYSTAFGWTRLPGAILLGLAALFALLGTLSVAARTLGLAFHFWPVLLIAGGLWFVYRHRRRQTQRARWS